MTRPYSGLLLLVLLLVPAGAWAGKLTCLTGTDPSVANDLSEIAVLRTYLTFVCPCGDFDGSKGKTHANYVACVSKVIGKPSANFRTQCKATVKKYYSVSTCGMPASKGEVPCIKTSAAGKVTRSIKPSTKCSGTACSGFTTCIDATDTNDDGIIGGGDSGSCKTEAGATCANGGIPIGAPCGTCGDGVCCGQGAPCTVSRVPAELCDASTHECVSPSGLHSYGCTTDADCFADTYKCVAFQTAANCGVCTEDNCPTACFAKCAE